MLHDIRMPFEFDISLRKNEDGSYHFIYKEKVDMVVEDITKSIELFRQIIGESDSYHNPSLTYDKDTCFIVFESDCEFEVATSFLAGEFVMTSPFGNMTIANLLKMCTALYVQNAENEGDSN